MEEGPRRGYQIQPSLNQSNDNNRSSRIGTTSDDEPMFPVGPESGNWTHGALVSARKT